MKKRIELAVFLVSLAGLAYALGFFTAFRHLPPAWTLIEAYEAAVDLRQNWENDLGFEPTRVLVDAPHAGAPEFELRDPDRTAPGTRLVSGLTPGRKALAGARLYDLDGTEIHYWPADYGTLAPGGESPNNVFLHGIAVFEDGSIVVNFDNGNVLARLDACGVPLWVREGQYHHAVTRAGEDSLWTWLAVPGERPDGREIVREHLVRLDGATGEEQHRISLEEDIVAAQEVHGQFALHTVESAESLQYCCDAFHPNDVEALPPEMADAFPMFLAGDLLLSFRSLNMIAVIDPGTAALKWRRIGPWHRQHDPDWLPDGTVSVYDNGMGLGRSLIRRVDPRTGEVWTAYRARPAREFYSWRRGKHQTLPNGNILITESERGRVLEVTPEGDTVWMFNNRYDEKRNGLVNSAIAIPPGFFTDGPPACAGADNGG